ncbi:MAG: UDP-N-acetylmuramate dehydrogenase [Candidatus Harrisonbacteria bacterium]|nr:UDP-N-acetylmuramate dehydrogenase [Candidatus Harrisonbacteria bacterium]
MVKIKRNISIVGLSTFKIGNKAKYFCEVRNDSELLEVINWGKKLKVPYQIIAGGSNVVFPDTNLSCLLIRIKSNKIKAESNKIIADAGVELAKVINLAVKNGLSGLETLSGIPGTLGGAIVGNAGAYGHSISEVVNGVEILDDSKTCWLKNKKCEFGYRESILKQKPYVVLRAVLKFKKGNAQELKKISQDIIQTRLKKYKPGLRCPGSFFKNVLVKDISKKPLALIDKNKIIEGKIPAGYLLEQVGAKGMRCGGIEIADFHGNLFVNNGNATAADVKKMAKILKDRVKKRFGINLEEEVRYF